MALSSTNLVPELQHFFNDLVKNSSLNKYKVPFPSDILVESFNQASFIQLLFDDSWPKTLTYFNSRFKEVSRTTWPQRVLDRTGIYSSSSKYFTSDNTSIATINLFNLQSVDEEMLSRLHEYRLDLLDSTTFNQISFLDMSTNISKMIYIYLDLKINSNFSRYNNLDLISDPNSVLESAYEAYLIETMFDYISARGT